MGVNKMTGLTRWSREQANQWAARLPWLVGCNFIPSTAINQLEMFQAQTFDPATIDRELGWAAAIGYNTVRVYLHDLVWEDDPEGFVQRLNAYLGIAVRHGIRTAFVLFDDCWNAAPKLGKQPTPVPGVHNSGWMQSPGKKIVNDPSQWDRLERYVQGVIQAFARDERVLFWDLYNEPGNNKQGVASLPLLKKAYNWARQANPTQPLTCGIWFDNTDLNEFQLTHSDILTFHNYNDVASLERQIIDLKSFDRPLVCTEWMRRPISTFPTHLNIFQREEVGCLQWGLVSGKTQTIYPWGSAEGSPEPEIWFHDLFHPDGEPYDPAEIEIIRKHTGK
jgi:hypothetical protein